MMSIDPRSSDRMSYYTMKTPALPPPAPSHSHSLSNPPTYLPTKSSTPLASPRLPYSVGQAYPPKLSPSAGRVVARASSPNYFGIAVEPATDARDSAAILHENRTPPSSSLKPFAAALPKQLPLDANPDFDAFRRQVDANRGSATFNLSGSHFAGFGGSPGTATPPASAPPVPSEIMRPRFARWHTHGSDTSERPLPRILSLPDNPVKVSVTGPPAAKMDMDAESLPDSAYVSFDSKHNSESSMDPPPSILSTTQFESPAQMDSPSTVPEPRRSDTSLPNRPIPPTILGKPCPPATGTQTIQRVDDASPKQELDPSMITPSQLKDLIQCAPESELLILDVRVSPQFAQSRIKGALNLCIPTTLLKRATYNLEKLQQTFQGVQTEKFANWRNTSHLIVYGASSPENPDGGSAMNMLKKFANEGYTGSLNILRGGFNTFAASYPDLVDHSPTASPSSFSLGANPGCDGDRPGVAPVIGGVMLPTAVNKANPFFSNIRQNQDLVDGVGQLDINVPAGLQVDMLPKWLRDAADKLDHGKKASDKFLQIELDEKSRMMDAYSVFIPATAATNAPKEPKIQLSGVERGEKNRYKDILPFEHARVRLEGRTPNSCDYVNASHLKSSRSHKRYIATQGPLPATFEDFWSVIWEQDVRVIVMLTAESEGGQLKCHPYWTGKEFGQIRLRSLSEKKVSLEIDKHRSHSAVHTNLNPSSSHPNTSSSHASHDNPFSWNTSQAEIGRRRANTTTTLESGAPTPAQPNFGGHAGAAAETPYVIVRKFALSHAAHPFSPIREITHLHYPSWPDFGAPAEPSHLLALVELANVKQRAALPIDVPGLKPTSPEARADNGSRRPGVRPGAVGNSWNGETVPPMQWHDEPEPSNSKNKNDNDLRGTRPMLVHCSAGCGRTGAFCTIDSVLDMLKRQRLRAARRANKAKAKGRGNGEVSGAGAEGEKRIAADQQLVGENMREKRRALGKGSDDGNGSLDVAMVTPPDFDDDAVSPLATFKEPANHHLAGWPDAVRTTTAMDDDGDTCDDDDSDEDCEGIDTSWLDDEAVDLVAQTVDDFRHQRLSMVQSLKQFVLCYETVLEWIWRLQQQPGGAAAKGRMRSGSLAM